MLTQLSRNWWWLALRGIAAILFGIIALAWHGATLRSFMLLFGSLALMDGLLAGFVALTIFAGGRRWWILLHGLVSVAISVFTLIWKEFHRVISVLPSGCMGSDHGYSGIDGSQDTRP